MDVRAKQRLCCPPCLFILNLRVAGFRPRHLNRYVASCGERNPAINFMKFTMRKQPFIKPFIVFLFVVVTILAGGTNSFGQFVEDYGNIGTLKTFKGQVRDAADGLVPCATVQFTNLLSETQQTVEADENGIFKVKDLPTGEYKVKVERSGFNITEFTVKISPYESTASKKFIIIRLSPGCASGGSVELESKIKKE